MNLHKKEKENITQGQDIVNIRGKFCDLLSKTYKNKINFKVSNQKKHVFTY